MSKPKTVKINITIPKNMIKGIRDRRKVDPTLNISRICTEAIRRELEKVLV